LGTSPAIVKRYRFYGQILKNITNVIKIGGVSDNFKNVMIFGTRKKKQKKKHYFAFFELLPPSTFFF
jgi:hypothetical protein